MKLYYLITGKNLKVAVKDIEQAKWVFNHHIFFRKEEHTGLYDLKTHALIGTLKREVTFTPIE